MIKKKSNFHPNNIHKNGYDFDLLIQKNPALIPLVFVNKYGTKTIDFSSSNAVKEINKALLKTHYNISFWEFPDSNLCPPIPGRVDYIHHIAHLIPKEPKQIKILDIGTGATCIYPLLGNAIYNWNFVGTDIDEQSLKIADQIIVKNNLENAIELRFQLDESHVLKGIISKQDSFSVVLCNPPFFKSAEEARGANKRKTRNLGTNAIRNFGGSQNELWYPGGEKAFLHTYLYESSKFPKSSHWFTSLVSKKDNVLSMEESSKKLGVTEFKVIPMHQGNKVTRIVAWRF